MCYVCGLVYADYEPWGPDGETPDHGICHACGVEFGYEDIRLESAKKFRDKWINAGAAWRFPDFKPQNWSLEKQLNNIPDEYR